MRSSAADRSTFSETRYQPPYGAIVAQGGVEFSFASRSATSARLLLYDRPEDEKPCKVISFDPDRDRLGDVWRIFVPGARAGDLYHFQVEGPYAPNKGLYFNPRSRLIDPYARALAGEFLPKRDGVCHPPKCVVIDDAFDWEGDRPISRAFGDEIIYELHVKGFTCSPTSEVSKPGSYLGVIEKIPYLRSLGVTAIELMPVHEFPTNCPNGKAARIHNYWGYDPIAFFAPHRGYAWDKTPGAQVVEFKEMVKALHRAGIEVYLDVVFNHTAEGNDRGEIFAFKGFENRNYYMLDSQNRYLNYSGCGNTINGNHPWTRELIFGCLRSWVQNFHVDGFRFDLASILSRDRNGNLVWNPPVLETISEDPSLAGTKFIAEAWDAAGAYQVGNFGTSRWAEWNGRFRDDVRKFWRGDDWSLGNFATRLSGSSDLYKKRNRLPTCSVNFITAHDGFTLNDLVSYNYKHNFANGENNRDGENNNISYNFGVEGETDDPRVRALRARQTRNFLCSTLLSQGVPMIVAGDEFRRTQRGNNNAYCQDSEISWLDWSLEKENAGLVRFVSGMIHFRRREATLRRRRFFTGEPQKPGGTPDVSWFNPEGGQVDWRAAQPLTFSCLLGALDAKIDPGFAEEISHIAKRLPSPLSFDVTEEAAPDSHFHILAFFNASSQERAFYFPQLARAKGLLWTQFVDTAAESPRDIYPKCDGPVAQVDDPVCVRERSIRIFIARAEL